MNSRRGPTSSPIVSRPKTVQNITSLQGFAESMSGDGHEILNLVVSFAFIPASEEVAYRLAVEPGDSVAEIRRVRLVNRVPTS